jgi:hypothetical protein
MNNIQVGDRVKLLGLPEWLTHDLPESEQVEMYAFIGQTTVVCEIDSYGYYWLGFGTTVDVGDSACYSGHSFGVPKEFIELVIGAS